MFKFQANGFQNYIDAWNEVFKKPVDASKFADFLDDTDIQSMIGLTEESSKDGVSSTVCQVVGCDTERLYTIKTSDDKYYRIYRNGKEIFTDEKFVKTLILGNVIYVQRECDERWNGINSNGNLVWNEWALSVKKVLSGDILVTKGDGSFFLADDNGVPIDIDVEKEKGEEDVKEDNKNTLGADDDEDCSVEEDDVDDINDDTEVEIEDDDDYFPDDENFVDAMIENKLRHFYAEKLPKIKREFVDTATELAEMFCEDIFQGVCNELTGSPDLYWDIESNNFPIIPDGDEDKSGGTPARDVVSDEEPTKPQEVSESDVKKVMAEIMKNIKEFTDEKLHEEIRKSVHNDIQELLNKKQGEKYPYNSPDSHSWYRTDTRRFS